MVEMPKKFVCKKDKKNFAAKEKKRKMSNFWLFTK
jgi:hypothetical protein